MKYGWSRQCLPRTSPQWVLESAKLIPPVPESVCDSHWQLLNLQPSQFSDLSVSWPGLTDLWPSTSSILSRTSSVWDSSQHLHTRGLMVRSLPPFSLGWTGFTWPWTCSSLSASKSGNSWRRRFLFMQARHVTISWADLCPIRPTGAVQPLRWCGAAHPSHITPSFKSPLSVEPLGTWSSPGAKSPLGFSQPLALWPHFVSTEPNLTGC